MNWPLIGEDALDVTPLTVALDRVVGQALFGPSSVVIRRSCFDDVGLFDPTLRCVEDRDMWVRLGSRHRLAILPLTLMWYRVHAASLSNKSAMMEQTELRVLAKAFSQIPALRRRWLFRRKTYSQAAFVSAQVYRDGGQNWTALRRVFKSLCLWPLPLRTSDNEPMGLRSRVLVNLLLRMAGLRATKMLGSNFQAAPQIKELPMNDVNNANVLARHQPEASAR